MTGALASLPLLAFAGDASAWTVLPSGYHPLAAAVIDVIANGPPFRIGFDLLLKFQNPLCHRAGLAVACGAAQRCSFTREFFNPRFSRKCE